MVHHLGVGTHFERVCSVKSVFRVAAVNNTKKWVASYPGVESPPNSIADAIKVFVTKVAMLTNLAETAARVHLISPSDGVDVFAFDGIKPIIYETKGLQMIV
jgi:hypothetical protein